MAAQFGRRLRKGATATTVAALVVAALSASEAPGSTSATVGGSAAEAAEPPGTAVTGNSPYFTDLPPLNTPNKPGKPGTSIDLPAITGPAEAGIPATVLAAYKRAEATISDIKPGCRLPWQLLAAIGKVESGQARGGRVDADGTTLTPILGPQLNGVGFANITDTDNGAYDGDVTHDRAVGPMQFIPSTWATWGQDGNDDGRKDPNNIYDAALAAGRYLCAHNRDLSAQGDLDQAILGYNRSREYLRTVMSWFDYYRRGNHEVPDGSGVLPGSGEPDSDDSDGSGGGRGNGNGRPGAPGGTTPPSSPETPKPGDSDGGGVKPPTTPPAKPPTTPPATPPPTPPPPTTPPPPRPPAPVAALERLGSSTVTATEGGKFTDRLRVRAKTSAGKTVASAKVQFWIVGDTAARFPGAATRVVVTTGIDGIATAPTLSAGGRTGRFMVHAKAVGTAAPAVDFAATVKAKPAPAPQSDALARTSDKELTAETGGSFADAVEVKATYKGKAAAGVGVTATMVTDDTDKPVENDKGPYFEDADGKTVRTLTALKTDANGLLKLPEIHTDGNAGTYKLRLTTADGVVLTVELTVTAATTAPADDPSESPSATPTA